MIRQSLFFSLLFCSFASLAHASRDSTGVENHNGKQLIIHKIEPKETYYSLGRKYQVSPKNIMDFNDNQPLTIGATVKIPTNRSFDSANNSVITPQANTSADKRESVHVVQSKETLYSIASRYNMRVDDLKLLNQLKSNNLQIGQTLKVLVNDEVSVKREVVEDQHGQPIVVKEVAVDQNKIKYLKDSVDSENHLQIPKNRYGITERNERGVAVTIDDETLDKSKSYALHNLAPVGTIIKITNPMTNRSIFAKVVGKYTENATTKDVIIVINKAVSDSLGALDKRFLVNITYGLPTNE